MKLQLFSFIVSLSPVDYKAVSLTNCNLLLLFCPSHHCVMITTTAGVMTADV